MSRGADNPGPQPLRLAPIDRTTLALYAAASSDHNPVHIDSDFARWEGLPDVFAHGMLSMSYLGRFLTDWIPLSRIRRFSVRFVSRVELGAALLCSGEILDINEHDGERLARVEMRVTGEAGELKVIGEAYVALAPVAGTPPRNEVQCPRACVSSACMVRIR